MRAIVLAVVLLVSSGCATTQVNVALTYHIDPSTTASVSCKATRIGISSIDLACERTELPH